MLAHGTAILEGERLLAFKPWGGRFSQETDRRVEEFTESISFDRRLFEHDIRGSIAHAQMLAQVGLMALGWIGFGLFALVDRLVAWTQRAATWPDGPEDWGR